VARPPSTQPTPGELEILRVLWSRGSATCREVLDALDRDQVGYTTVLKLLQIMVAKGLAEREDGEGRSHVYRATASEKSTQRRLVRDLMDRAFGGKPADLVLQALSARPASPAELEEIQRILTRARSRTGGGEEG
jgi:predicted transcriptional regulator